MRANLRLLFGKPSVPFVEGVDGSVIGVRSGICGGVGTLAMVKGDRASYLPVLFPSLTFPNFNSCLPHSEDSSFCV